MAKRNRVIQIHVWSFVRHHKLFAGCYQDCRLADSELNGSAPCEPLGLLV